MRRNLMQRRADQNITRQAKAVPSEVPAQMITPANPTQLAAPVAPGLLSCGCGSSSSSTFGLPPRLTPGNAQGVLGISSVIAVNGHIVPKPMRQHHMTNFELERLFAVTTASPATVAALRYGGARGASVAERMRQQL